MKKKMLIFTCLVSLIWLISLIILLTFLPKKASLKYKKLNEIKSYEVKLTGAVNFPGYYHFKKGDRLDTLIGYAMGLSSDADLDKIILNRELKENEKEINIPFKKINYKKDKINLNSASYDNLKASGLLSENKIIEILIYRKEKKEFKSIEELKNIKGIGDAFFNKIKDSFTI